MYARNVLIGNPYDLCSQLGEASYNMTALCTYYFSQAVGNSQPQ